MATFITQDPPGVMAKLQALPQAAAFLTRLDAFLDVYGERLGEGYGSEVTICTPTWREDPTQFLQIIASFLDSQIEPPSVTRERARKQRDAQVDVYCQACSDETAVAEFRRQLAYARQCMAVLEEHNHYIEQVSGGQLRQAIMASASWLVQKQVLAQPDDVFWLTFAEITATLRSQPATNLATAIRQRQSQQAAWSLLSPPPVLGVPDANLGQRPAPTDEVTEMSGASDVIQGIGASPGQAHGRARLMLDPYSLPPDLTPGDILVAPNIGPMWTPIFPVLGGLVLDSGTLGQHAAATAREYGLTAVVATGRATRQIPEGAMILVNGEDGRVQII